MEQSEINKRFDYHAPNDYTKSKHEEARGVVRILAEHLNQLLPDSREKSEAFTHLEDVLMWSNAAIARN